MNKTIIHPVRMLKNCIMVNKNEADSQCTEVIEADEFMVGFHYVQSKRTISSFNFHSTGLGLVIQSIGSARGCTLEASSNPFLMYFFCSSPKASGSAEINKGALLSARSRSHCLFFSQGIFVVSPMQSPSAA